MKYTGSLLVVNDIVRSRRFYETILGQKVILDLGENVTFEGNFVLQTKAAWMKFVGKSEADIMSRCHNFELCFEEENFTDFITHLQSCEDIEYVHTALEYSWGQRVVRLYDPDKHIVEIGESMKSVISRFLSEGLSIEEAAKRSHYPREFINTSME